MTAPVLHRRDASFKVLHWPKLFDGWVRITGEYRNHGDGELAGDGLGGGYIGGAIAKRGDGTGYGHSYGWGCGDGKGNGSSSRMKEGGGVGAGTYSNIDGNGWSKQSV